VFSNFASVFKEIYFFMLNRWDRQLPKSEVVFLAYNIEYKIPSFDEETNLFLNWLDSLTLVVNFSSGM